MIRDWRSRAISPADVAAKIPSGSNVFVHGTSATPIPLLHAMAARQDLERVRIYSLHLEGAEPLLQPGVRERLFTAALFCGSQQRKAIEAGYGDFWPIFLSNIPRLFETRVIDLDVAVLQVSPPDKHGWCTLGTSVDCALSAARAAKLVIAEVNERMPRTHGNSTISFDRIDHFCVTNRSLPQSVLPPETDVEARIGDTVARLVEDGSCLQAGIGAIPNAVLRRLKDKHDLGIHTEMFSDGVVELYEAGAITNINKSVHPRRLVTSFVAGTDRTFDFVDDNPRVEFHPCDRTNDVRVISRLERVVAINSALEIDLTGQVCADSIGPRIYSGIGGQMDFMQGAALTEGGKPIIAIPSTASRGTVSRISPMLKQGAGVVTSRGHVHWVVSEYGAVNLHGKGLRDRGELLISISHPDFRSELRDALAELRHFPVTQPV
ncbi:MAG: acetyl-CoA hydrolase/transferase family protein [Planctomycetes bacterium]|nr:acetyl-CoA hydrolase/transferase family protein [Planctomycetota bacterium]